MENIYLNRSVCIVYSPDDGDYYLEDRNPNNWRISKQTFKSYQNAKLAFEHGMITWDNA